MVNTDTEGYGKGNVLTVMFIINIIKVEDNKTPQLLLLVKQQSMCMKTYIKIQTL